MGVPKTGTWRGGRWALAPTLVRLEAEANSVAPRRRRSSDGSIGDAAHRNRKSNHNPQEAGALDYVDALDISHDPANGMDIHARVRQWVAAKDDRLDEVISNRQIWTYARRSEGWRRYTGDNGHTIHAHITVRDSHRHSTRPWFSGAIAFPTPGPPPFIPPEVSEEDDMQGKDDILIVEGVGIIHMISGQGSFISLDDLVWLRAHYDNEDVKLLEQHVSPSRYEQMLKS